MDAFFERLGEGYLERKVNAIPQQLENLAVKQFKNQTNTEKQAKQASKLPSGEKDQEIARLRRELALVKLDKGKATVEAKQMGAGRTSAKVGRDLAAFEALDERRSTKQKPQVHNGRRDSAELEALGRRRSTKEKSSAARAGAGALTFDALSRRRSVDERDSGRGSHTTLIPASQGRRRRSPTYPSGARSSMDSIEPRRDARYDTSRYSRELDRRELYLVEVTEEPVSRRRTSDDEPAERKRDRKEKRYYDDGPSERGEDGWRNENGRSGRREEEENTVEIKKDRTGRMYMMR